MCIRDSLQPLHEKIIWQQDGTPPLYGNIVREFLKDKFNEWIRRQGTTELAAHSPDLSPMDLSVWEIMKDRTHSQKFKRSQGFKRTYNV